MKIPDIAYRSPVIRYDPLAQIEIFERRNVETGDIAYQAPDAETVKRLDETAGPAAPSAPNGTSSVTAAPANASAKVISLIV
jgi:hypothetical protein